MTYILDYARIEGATAPAFSVDGRTLFHLRGAGLSQVWALDLQTGATWQLSDHDERVTLLRRAPGDDRLVYAVDAGGDERHQLWLWEDGVSRALTDAPSVIHGFGSWSPDGSRIAFTANDRDEAHFDLIAMNLETGARQRLAEGVHEATVGPWNTDGTSILFVQDRSTTNQRPFIVAVCGDANPVPRRAAMPFTSLRWDEQVLLGLTEVDGFMALCRIDPATGDITTAYAAAGRDVDAWSLSPAGMLATLENDRGYSVLRVGPRDGPRPVVDLSPGVITDLAWSADGRLAFSLSGPTRPAGLWVWSDGSARPAWQPDCALPLRDFALVEWTGMDGSPIPGLMAVPDGERPDAGWPAVVWVHGGPAMQARPSFRPDMQALLAQGYAVLMPNVRGSTGYGRAYMDADDVEKRLDSVHDLAAGHAFLARQPGIDPTRIAVMGQSYGGYMVLAAITEYPDRWRCAIDFYGIADFGTLLATTGPWRRGHRAAEYGDPSRHRALFDRISPIRHIDRVRVPLLVLHGTRDPRVGFGESTQVVDALRKRQRPVQFEVFDYAGHGFIRPDDKARVYAAVQKFLAAHL
jgi:dipeptidyl aminopeptidase/acylaminoacyl peptidase